jgi:hypothetical protein
MAATRLSDSQKQELVARFCGGASLQQLAKLFRCSPTTVSRTAKAAIDLAEYERLLKQLKAQRGGSSPGDGALLGELHLQIAEDCGASPGLGAPNGLGDATDLGDATGLGDGMGHGDAAGLGDAVDAPALTTTEPGVMPELATMVGAYGLGEFPEQPPQGSSPQPGAGPIELPAGEALAVQQGALELPGAREFDGAAPDQSPVLPSSLADPVPAAAVVTDVPRTIPGRRRRSGAAIASTPAAPLPDTDLAPTTGPTPADLVTEAGPGELAIDDADDFGADDGEDDLSDDPGEEIFFGHGETFVSIPVGPIIDDLAIHEAVPFSAAVLPSSAFLLVDKTVELQARTLRELPELGRLAEDELDRQALVVFVNPRQAKRQCGRTQRVIPLPDPSLLERTAPYLMAHGITRLVIEGALYSLPGA